MQTVCGRIRRYFVKKYKAPYTSAKYTTDVVIHSASPLLGVSHSSVYGVRASYETHVSSLGVSLTRWTIVPVFRIALFHSPNYSISASYGAACLGGSLARFLLWFPSSTPSSSTRGYCYHSGKLLEIRCTIDPTGSLSEQS